MFLELVSLVLSVRVMSLMLNIVRHFFKSVKASCFHRADGWSERILQKRISANGVLSSANLAYGIFFIVGF